MVDDQNINRALRGLKFQTELFLNRGENAGRKAESRLRGLVVTDSNGPSLSTALQEQLGVKLDSTKGPVNVIVIDHVEKPTSN